MNLGREDHGQYPLSFRGEDSLGKCRGYWQWKTGVNVPFRVSTRISVGEVDSALDHIQFHTAAS